MNRYRLTQDNDGHWYIIRAEEDKLFEEWVEAEENCEECDHNYDKCRINGPHTLTFIDPKED